MLVVDDHPVVQEGLARLLAGEEKLECVGVANNGREAVEVAKELEPDVVPIGDLVPRISTSYSE